MVSRSGSQARSRAGAYGGGVAGVPIRSIGASRSHSASLATVAAISAPIPNGTAASCAMPPWASVASSGFGLAGMRERIALSGGALEINPASPGTIMRATLPLAAVQFHPESLMTLGDDVGLRLLVNVMDRLASAPE